MNRLTPSELLRLMIPGSVALLLLLLCALPMVLLNIALTPHVVWLMSLGIGSLFPPAWPVTLAFGLGLLSDFLYGTPLGCQALLALAITIYAQRMAALKHAAQFQVRWAEAAAVLLAAHAASWAIHGMVMQVPPPFIPILLGALVNALWFPAFYLLCRGLMSLLPVRT